LGFLNKKLYLKLKEDFTSTNPQNTSTTGNKTNFAILAIGVASIFSILSLIVVCAFYYYFKKRRKKLFAQNLNLIQLDTLQASTYQNQSIITAHTGILKQHNFKN
jgi:hypothetical protein